MQAQTEIPANISVKDAAKELSVSERTITRRLKAYSISPKDTFIIGNTRRISLSAWSRIKSLEYAKNF